MRRLLVILVIVAAPCMALLPTTTTTVVHNSTHQVVTTVGADDPVHPLVTVVGQPGNPAPTGRLIIDLFSNQTCTGSNFASSQPTLDANANGTADQAGQIALALRRPGFLGFDTRYSGDALYAPSESPCAAVEFVGQSTCPNNGQPRLAFDPVSPDSSQVIVFTVGVPNYFFTQPTGAAVATLQGNIINVTLTAFRGIIGTPPPLQCTTAFIGALAAGTYPVNFLLIDTNPTPQPPTLIATSTVTVVPGSTTVPTVSHEGIAALALLLSVAGWFGLRRRVI